MRKAIVIAMVVLIALTFKSAFAAEGGKKGAGAKAYEHANEQAIFYRVSDWFATIGKSPEEKAKILKERRRERAEKRAEKQIRKSQRKEERLKKQQASGGSEVENRIRARKRMEDKIRTGRGKGKGKK